MSDNSIDGLSKKKVYSLFENNLINEEEIGTTKSLQKIHTYIFDGLYECDGRKFYRQHETKSTFKGCTHR